MIYVIAHVAGLGTVLAARFISTWVPDWICTVHIMHSRTQRQGDELDDIDDLQVIIYPLYCRS